MFSDGHLGRPGLLGSSAEKGRLRRSFGFDCAPDHISVANADLFISYRTFPQSGPLGKAVQRSCSAWAALFFWIAAARPRSTRYPWSGVIGLNRAPFAVETLASADAFLDVDRGFPRRSWIHRSRARLLRKAQL